MSNSSSNHLSDVEDILSIVLSVIPIPFCFFALTALIYYVKRRIKLYNMLRHITSEQMRETRYQMHIKNLKIKSMISNFVIIILVVEIVNNICFTLYFTPVWVEYFAEERDNFVEIYLFVDKFVTPASYLEQITGMLLVPILCLLLKVLWLTYLHCGYKYTVMRWTWYSTVRVLFWLSLFEFERINPNYLPQVKVIGSIFFAILFTTDFIIYLSYSRRFYLHLKSREKEAFYFLRQRKIS